MIGVHSLEYHFFRGLSEGIQMGGSQTIAFALCNPAVSDDDVLVVRAKQVCAEVLSVEQKKITMYVGQGRFSEVAREYWEVYGETIGLYKRCVDDCRWR